jgi:hypothetical protein
LLRSDANVRLRLGDDAGVNQVSIENSSGFSQASIDSNGFVVTSGLRASDIESYTGFIQLAGANGTNNEDLDWDFETVANEVGVSSDTGVDRIDFGTIALDDPQLVNTKLTIFISASAGLPVLDSPCSDPTQRETTTNKIQVMECLFDGSTNESWQVNWKTPENYTGGDITVRVVWGAASGSGTTEWDISAGSIADGDSWDVALSSAVTVTDTLLDVGDYQLTPESGAITPTGSPAGGDHMIIQGTRDAVTDTHNADAGFAGIEVTYPIDAVSARD